MNHSWNHDPFQGGGPVPHRPKKQRKPIGTPLGRTLLNLAVTLIFGAVYFYIVLPPLNLHSGEFYVFVLLLCAVYCGCAILTSGFQGSGAKGYFGFVKKQCTVPFVLAAGAGSHGHCGHGRRLGGVPGRLLPGPADRGQRRLCRRGGGDQL